VYIYIYKIIIVILLNIFASYTIIFTQPAKVFPDRHYSIQQIHFFNFHFFHQCYSFRFNQDFSILESFLSFLLADSVDFRHHYLIIFHKIPSFMFYIWAHRQVVIIIPFIPFYPHHVCKNILSIEIFLLDRAP
jgi:hypothetical protein